MLRFSSGVPKFILVDEYLSNMSEMFVDIGWNWQGWENQHVICVERWCPHISGTGTSEHFGKSLLQNFLQIFFEHSNISTSLASYFMRKLQDPSTSQPVTARVTLDFRDLTKEGHLLTLSVLPHVLHEVSIFLVISFFFLLVFSCFHSVIAL